jgi:NAD(P)H-dependent flavin oxidoreductase YrpB (nitropropane dioxygenase family)
MLRIYARVCAWSLAQAHARTGDAAMISGYMGSSQTFDDAICEFAAGYADQTIGDHKAFAKAIREGQIQAITQP